MIQYVDTLKEEPNKWSICNVSETLEKLNEQHEQIQELIQSSKELEEDCQSTFNAMSRKQDDLYRKNFKLKEENEQLKQFIDDLTTKGTGRIDLANGYSYSVSAVLTNWNGDVE